MPILSILVVDTVSELKKPKFKDLHDSVLGGAPVLLALWERFDFSLLLTQTGIFKLRGVPTWQIAFAFIVGLVAKCTSDLDRVTFLSQDAVMKMLMFSRNVSQSAMSRFLTGYSKWQEFTKRRVERLQRDPDTALAEGDVIALDDTLIPHPFAKKLPFLAWLFDHSKKVYVWAQNLVALHAIKESGVEYPLFFAFWRKPKEGMPVETKFDLALKMLQDLRATLSAELRLWVSMDRWFFNKDFFLALETLNFDWVTKAKRNTVFYRLVPGPVPGSKERYVRVNARELLRQNYHFLVDVSASGLVSLALPNIFLMHYEPVPNAKGRKKRKKVFTPVAAVAVIRLKEDQTKETGLISQSSDEEPAATYKGSYLLISNRVDMPAQVVVAYQKRWQIEILFRNAKQELGLTKCHSNNENHANAHVALLFTAETLIRFAQWEHNVNAGAEEALTHGKVVRLLFRTRSALTTTSTHHGKSDVVQLYFHTAAQRFASLLEKYWPSRTGMVTVHTGVILTQTKK